MAKIDPPFNTDELASIENIINAGYDRKMAEGTILNLRRGMRTAHCTELGEWLESKEANERKKLLDKH